MTYTLIGTGNMGWFLAARMLSAGHTCVGVWGRNERATEGLSAAYYFPRLGSIQDAHDGPDMCLVAVTDTSIVDVVKSFSYTRTTLIHTAGSQSIDLVAKHSANAGVVWPVYSIKKESLPAHRSFAAITESNTPDAAIVVRAVAKALCDTVYEAKGEQRRWLHLAAVVGNNFVNHLLGVANDICLEHGLPVSLLQPLIEQSINATRSQHPALLQTGPAKRRDTLTMEQHLAMLNTHPEWYALYTALSSAIMERHRELSKD